VPAVATAAAPTPPFTAEHEAFRAEVREFVAAELRPHAAEWEAACWFPDSVFAACAGRGYLGLKYDDRFGYLHDAVFAEELARCGSGGLAAGIGAHASIATPPVWKFGTAEQKARFLAPAIAGELVGALAITEPDAGSDVAGIRTRARRVDGGWVVDGAKTFITNGVRAGFYVCAVKTTEDGGHGGLSFLLVEPGEGVRASALAKLGWHASDTAEIGLSEVFVPEEHLLGEVNRGFYLIMANFQWERLLMALGAVGSMRAAVEKLTSPEAGLGPRGRARVAEVAVLLAAGEAVTYHALRLFASGQDAVREVTMAKLQTQRACVSVHDACLDLLGDDDPEIARAWRDARLGPIGGGTDEIMREILGKTLGL
jgi:acyl-CoA dehydrogenase